MVRLDKFTLISSVEDQRNEAQAYYDAKFARFSKDRRQAINSDDSIRNFLLTKKADIVDIIRENMKKVKRFPKKETMAS